MAPDDTQPEAAPAEEPASEALASEESARAARHITRRRAFHRIFLIVGLAILVRMPQVKFPMGHVAGTPAYVGQRWLDGAVPYRDAWDHRAPGLCLLSGTVVRKLAPVVAYLEQRLLRASLGSIGKRVRVTPGEAAPEACRLAMLVTDLVTMFLVYMLVHQWCHRTEAIVAAGVFGFFSGTILVQGDCIEAGPPMALLVTLAMLAALRSGGVRWRWIVLSGLAAGLAVCFEALAVLYVVLLTAWYAATDGVPEGRTRRRMLRPVVLLAAASMPVAAFVAWFWWHGALGEFWRSAVVFNVLYRWLPLAPAEPAYHWWVVRELAPEQSALWLFAGGWAVHAFSIGFRRETRLIVLWGIVALLAAMVPARPEAAAFLQTVPPMAIGAALALTNPSEPFLKRSSSGRIDTRSAMLAVLAIGLVSGLVYTEYSIFRVRASRTVLTTNRAVVHVADIVRDRTMPNHEIYVWGRYPQIYVIADRPAAHRMFYTRPLNIAPIVRDYFGEGIFDDIEQTLLRKKPPYIVSTEEALPGALRPLYDPKPIGDERLTIFARKDRAATVP